MRFIRDFHVLTRHESLGRLNFELTNVCGNKRLFILRAKCNVDPLYHKNL